MNAKLVTRILYLKYKLQFVFCIRNTSVESILHSIACFQLRPPARGRILRASCGVFGSSPVCCSPSRFNSISCRAVRRTSIIITVVIGDTCSSGSGWLASQSTHAAVIHCTRTHWYSFHSCDVRQKSAQSINGREPFVRSALSCLLNRDARWNISLWNI